MDRRGFLRVAIAGTAAATLGGSLWRRAVTGGREARYGELGAPDGNGIQLPRGFHSRVVARSRSVVPGTSYVWHDAPDGGACFPDGDGWIYVSNSEIDGDGGGASAIRFRPDGAVVGAHRILGGTNRNCAGGATPWGTWLSCEEISRGQVYETFPDGSRPAVVRPAMGAFQHEAAAVDPARRVVYLTEDRPDGCFYRFVPTMWPDLSAGRLEVLKASPAGAATWAALPDPKPLPSSKSTRRQVPGAATFAGGEGAYYADGFCWFTTKGDNRVWRYDAAQERIDVEYDDELISGTPLLGVDNITGTRSGDLYVAEDGGNMEICRITPSNVVSAFLRVNGQPLSELTGPAFSPDGSRLYFSSQRGATGTNGGGITYEVRGPFRKR